MPDRLHPALQALLADQGWDSLTPAQDVAHAPIRDGQHVLLVAPTGHGKTEAALLPVLDRLLAERDALASAGREWPTGFKVLYVTPLRALNRDLMERLAHWGDALDVKVGVRHGDTTQAERARQSRNPPDLLITTPETLQLLLYGERLRSHLRTVRFVILDEVHDLAASERGAQLAIAMERVEAVIGGDAAKGCFQRIGLSATIQDPAAVATFLAGQRDVQIIQAPGGKDHALRVTVPTEPDQTPDPRYEELAAPDAAIQQLRLVRHIVQSNARTLIFQNTRDAAELMATRSAALDDLMELHHGSLSAEVRRDVEQRFKAGEIRGLVATSSLELGIDVGAIDHVIQVASPRSVARLLQRLGRAGHRLGQTSHGTLVAAPADDVAECIVVAENALAGTLEPIQGREAPLAVLTNQIIAMSNQGAALAAADVYRLVSRAGPYLDLDEGMFDATWDALVESKTVFTDERGRITPGGRSRRHFLGHISMIQDDKKYRVLDEAAKRIIGSLDDAFVATLYAGALFVMAGRPWQILAIDAEDALVRVGPVRDVGAVPQWTGSDLPVTRLVAQGVVALRRRLLAGDRPSIADEAAIHAALEPLERHRAAGLEVPTDRLVTIESARRMVVINVALGTRGNEALGRVLQALIGQRHGPVGLDHDAYRIHLTLPAGVRPIAIDDVLSGLDPDAIDVILTLVLKDSPSARHHLVAVAKWFGALPDAVEPDRFTRVKSDALMAVTALQEETLARLIHERLDPEAVADFLRDLHAGRIEIIHQGLGPVSTMAKEARDALLAPPRTDARLLQQVRRRIEDASIMLACTGCRNTWDAKVADLPRRIHCRRCQSIQVACVGPWAKDIVRLIGQEGLTADQRKDRERLVRNAGLVAGFGSTACRALAARGIGPDGAARLLQKSQDPQSDVFWRELLVMELEFARNSAYWRR